MKKPEVTGSILESEITRRRVLGELGKLTTGALFASPALALLAACGGGSSPTGGTKISSVRIAGVFDLTGVSAFFGAGARDGAKQVFDSVNSTGGLHGLGGAKIDYAVYDAGSQPTNATALVQRAYDEGAAIVIGCGNGGDALAGSLAASQVGKPFVTGDPTDTMTTRGLTTVYQVGPVVAIYARQVIDETISLMQKAGSPLKKAAVVRQEIATFNALSPVMLNYLKGKGIDVVDLSYPTSQTTFGSIVTQVRNSGAQALFQLSQSADGIGILRAAKVQGYQPTAIAGVIAAYTDPSFWTQLGPDGEGIYGCVQFSTALPYSWLAAEVSKWSANYGNARALDAFSAAYMAVGATVVDALNRAGSTGNDKILKALKATNLDNKTRFVTIPGGVKFSDKGANNVGEGVIVQDQKGKVLPIAPANSAVAKPEFPRPNWPS